jgi:hypothetical protein
MLVAATIATLQLTPSRWSVTRIRWLIVEMEKDARHQAYKTARPVATAYGGMVASRASTALWPRLAMIVGWRL